MKPETRGALILLVIFLLGMVFGIFVGYYGR